MNSLNRAIKAAFDSSGNNKEVNKAYVEFIKANFIIPIENNSHSEDPKVLFLQEDEKVILPVFTEMTYLDAWANSIKHKIELLKLSGVDLLKGIGDDVSVGLDIGSEYYKEFYPAEIARMRSLILKFFKQDN